MPTLDEHRREWSGIRPARIEDAPEPTVRPWCWNRPPFMPEGGEWNARQGYPDALLYLLRLRSGKSRWRWTGERWELSATHKPRYRWRRWFSTEQCRAWDCSPTEIPTPVRDRWDCRGCRWLPERGRIQYGSAGAEPIEGSGIADRGERDPLYMAFLADGIITEPTK